MKTGIISLHQPLDYETLREYVLTIEARDGGTPSLSSTAAVKINVTDANDNMPNFSQEQYQVTLKENIPVNSMVIEVCSVQSCCDDKIDYSSVMINDMFSDFISFEHNKKYVLGFARTISYM